jgi:hypothetical protein
MRTLLLIFLLVFSCQSQMLLPIVGGSTADSVTCATPTFDPVAGTYTGTQSVAIASTTSGATICYTVDGSTPAATTPGTCSTGTTYTGAVSVASSLTIKAIATRSGDTNSAVGSAAYEILGTELVTNGDFTDCTGWTSQTGWACGSGVATATNASSSNGIYRAMTFSNATKYRVVFTVGGYSGSGNVDVSFGSAVTTARSSNGTYTQDITTTATGSNVYILAHSTLNCTVDNLSVKQVK